MLPCIVPLLFMPMPAKMSQEYVETDALLALRPSQQLEKPLRPQRSNSRFCPQAVAPPIARALAPACTLLRGAARKRAKESRSRFRGAATCARQAGCHRDTTCSSHAFRDNNRQANSIPGAELAWQGTLARSAECLVQTPEIDTQWPGNPRQYSLCINNNARGWGVFVR